jgi:hypothetical protein
VQIDSQKNEVLEIQEKKFFTSQIENEITSLGVYYFRSGELLLQSLNEQLLQNLKYGNEFYISLAIKAMKNKLSQLKILDFRIQNLLQLGTPSDLERFEFWFDFVVHHKTREEFRFIEFQNRPLNLRRELFNSEKDYWLMLFKYFKILNR